MADYAWHAPNDELCLKMKNVQLDVKYWLKVFKEQLGVQSAKAFQYVGQESYQLLVQYIREPGEKKALRELLGMETKPSFHEYLKKQREMLMIRQRELDNTLNDLNSHSKAVRERQNDIALKLENDFREMLQIPENSWIGEKVTMINAIEKMEKMRDNILTACSECKNDQSGASLVLKAGGLRGIWVRSLRNTDSFSKRNDILREPKNICLNYPLLAPCIEQRHFQSKAEETQFMKQVPTVSITKPDTASVSLFRSATEGDIGRLKRPVRRESKKGERVTYSSTVRYCFMPIASCSFDDHNLQLSHDALSQLDNIKQAIVNHSYNIIIEDECESFFRKYGSHICRGPLHFGGILMWKCYSKGYAEAEKQSIQELQVKVIDALMTMQLHVDVCSAEICVSEIKGDFGDFPIHLVNNTFIQIIMTGTPVEVIGLPDWKNCLYGNSERWDLIDRGLSQVPVWEVILMNHKTYSTQLADVLKEAWIKLNNAYLKTHTTVLREGVQGMIKQVEQWGVESHPAEFEAKLERLLQIKRKNESLLDLEVWATEYIAQPCFRDYLCSNIKACIKGKEDITNVKKLLRDLVEPVDLGITDVFSTERDVFQSIYDTNELPLPILQEDFLRVERYFKLALKLMSSTPSMQVKIVTGGLTYPQDAIRGTARVENAVRLLRNHFVKSGQYVEDCLLVTLLRPLEFDPVKQRFPVLLTKSDISYLCEIFSIKSKDFFLLLNEKPLFNAQAYLLDLTIIVSDIMSSREECILANISYLREKIKLCPELEGHLKNLQLKKTDWRNFQREMRKLSQEVAVTNDTTPPLKEILREEQSTTPAAQVIKTKVVPKVASMKPQSRQELVRSSLQRLGLHEYFPQKLSLRDAREIREDTLKALHPKIKSSSDAGRKSESDFDKYSSDQAFYPFTLLQQIMAFDHRWTTRPNSDSSKSGFDSNSEDSDSDSEDLDSYSDGSDFNFKNVYDDEGIHPRDCLLALLHCSDNFLRQDLLSRLATCQLAVPLLLPHPFTQEPTLLLWALRSIVKEFKSHDNTPYCGRIITSPTPFVSFLRIGHHSRSKSEILCNVINSSDNKHDVFLHYNSLGGTRRRLLAKGLVDMSWYLPSDDLFPNAVAFVNLHGDASSSDLEKQINFLCEVCTMHVVLLRDSMLKEDATRECTIKLLNTLSLAKGGVIVLQNESKGKLTPYCDPEHFKTQFTIVRLKRCKGLADIGNKIRGKISKKLETIISSTSLADAARKYKIAIDEDDAECIKGRKLAEGLFSTIDEHQKAHPKESPKKLLTLQSTELWHKWAEADKEQYRMKRKGHEMTVDEYGQRKRIEMNTLRRRQYEIAKMSLSLEQTTEDMHHHTMLMSFLTTLKTHEGNVIWYYMLWLKFKLDDLSRKLLPPLHTQYLEKRNEISNIQSKDAEKKCQDELKLINTEIVNASFGLEHLLREVSQVYEAVMAQENDPEGLKDAVSFLPQKAAQLLYEGFPIELLDGDASHMPQQWISDVLSHLSNICKRKVASTSDTQIYVLSVLGLQSTGKSTMLNTLFGVQFAVSAGRCTRGAFMQLIPVHQSLHEKCGVNFFLLVDTEGLRAPEFNALEAQKHDNELATFVIAMANLTLINVPGEVSGDMDNILETAVYAFLRMRKVELKPSCHFVHQHVTAIGADEKLSISRLKIKDHLDTMTQSAAKDTGLVKDNVRFNDIISVDYERDVSFFPDLWNGKLPMARVNTAYSDEAQNLKHVVIRNCVASRRRKNNSIASLRAHLQQLWKAILQEDFVFSFKNMDEISAYKCLEEQFGEWSWSFKKEMIDWEKTAENRIMGCTTEQFPSVHKELSGSLPKDVREIHKTYETKMNAFFDESTEIMLKWKQDTEIRLQRLCEELQHHADNHCKQLFLGRNGRLNVEKKNEELVTKIRDRVKQLVGTLEKDTMKEEELMKIFEESWKSWIPELTSNLETMEHPHIPLAVDRCLSEFFQTERKFLYEKIDVKPITAWGTSLQLTVVEAHLNIKSGFLDNLKFWNQRSCKQYIPLAQKHTTTTLAAVKKHLEDKQQSKENFKPQFVTELLNLIQKERLKSKDVFFTEEYHVEIALTACGYAMKVFEEMATAFRRKHDPMQWIECEMKPYFKKVFVNKYYEVKKEKVAAITLCQQLEDPIKKAVIDSLSLLIVNEMRGTYSWIKTKKTFIAKVLLEIGKGLEEKSLTSFAYCIDFLTYTDNCLEDWVKHFTQSHCDSGECPTHLSRIAEHELSDSITFILEKVKHVHLQQQPFPLNDWLELFHAGVRMKLNIQLSTLRIFGDDQEISDANFFIEEVVKGIKELHDRLIRETFSIIEYSQIEPKAHVTLYAQIAGCTSQCPFCQAQCELTLKNHPITDTIKHTTHHRPECLGNCRWEKDNTMVLDICSSSVASDCKFHNKDTNDKWVPYKKYATYYPEWSISQDMSLDASLFWKWFLGHYSSKLEEYFVRDKTKIPDEWKKLKWTNIEKWLKEEYNL